MKYFFFVIDVFSRYLYIELFIDKFGGRVKIVFKLVFECGVKLKYFCIDGGFEF